MEDLTAEDLMAYEQLVDPDAEKEGASFDWGDDMNRNILGMVLGDRQFLAEAVDLLQPSYFENKAHRAVCALVIDHFQEWKVIPNRAIILSKLKSRFKDDDDRLFYATELDLCNAAFTPGLDSRDYNLTLLTGFAKKQAMKEAIRRVLDEIKRGDFATDATMERISAHIDKAKAVDRKFTDIGHKFFQDVDSRYAQISEEHETVEVFTTGFKRIDESLSDGGMRRGEVGSIMGLSGSGKSLVLTKVAWHNVLDRRRVLFISTEMDEISIAKRFDALFTGYNIRQLLERREEVKPIIKRIGADLRGTDAVDGCFLLIKRFAQKTSNINTYRSLMAELLQRHGWVPDMVILDYVGECKDYADRKTYESRELLVSEFAGFSVEARFVGLTAMQPNRSARDVQKEAVIDDSNLGDAFGQTRPLHFFWSLNQRDEEKKMNVARIFVIKHRNGDSRFLFYVKFDPSTLEYREISEESYRNTMQGYADDVSKGTKVDDFYAHKERKKKTRFDDAGEPRFDDAGEPE